MANTELISNMADFASFFYDGTTMFRIVYPDHEQGFIWCTDADGCEYQINYNEIDLATDKFYKAVEMDPKDYEDVQNLSG